jgi:uncharacterized protein (TIGR02598 family)
MMRVFLPSNENPSSLSRREGRQAFSLVEVVFALGIATFAVLAIAALLPAGIQSANYSLEESGALNVLSEAVADRQAMPLTNATTIYHLPLLTPTMAPITNTFWVGDNNQYSATSSQARYRVTCSFTPPAAGTLNPYLGYFKVSWPAASTNAVGYVDTVVTFPQP